MKNHIVAVFSKNPSLADWCNCVLGDTFLVFWLQDTCGFPETCRPVAVISDFDAEAFSRVYDFFWKNRIRCYFVSGAGLFSSSEWERFPKAKFIDEGNDLMLRLSVESEYHLSPMRTTFDVPENLVEEYYRRLLCASQSDENVLLLGNLGAGKTHDAMIIHQNSKRKDRPFISFTMAESNLNSVEGDLFGIAKNTYTGVSAKEGVLRMAQGGTLFFDEITEIPLEMQSKLLTVISERKFRQKGSDREESFTGRFIFATNADIDRLVREKKFRADLYSRINVLRLRVPDLNCRTDDITDLAVEYAAEKNKTLTKDALRALKSHNWTGNIRQLRNVVVRACTFSRTSVVDQKDLSFD